MKKLLLLLLLPLLCCLPLAAEEGPFEGLARQFLDGYLGYNPESATVLGDHRFDGAWTDYTPQGMAEAEGFYARSLRSLEGVDRSALSRENQIDFDIYQSNLEGMLFGLRDLQEYRWNPLYYNPGPGIYPLIARDYAPLPQRLESLARRLDGIPKLLAEGRANLNNPPRLHTETAIAQNKGSISLIRDDLTAILEQAPEMKARLEGPRQRALAALEEHGAWLENDLLPRSKGNFRLGAALYRKKLAYTLESALTQEQVLSRAQSELKKTQLEMETVARPLYRKLTGKDDALVGRREVCKAVLDLLAEHHPSNANIVAQAAADLARCTSFVKEKQLMTVTGETCKVVEMPEFNRGVAVAYCDSPGPLEGKGETFYAIAPTPADWTPQRVTSFFREYNDYMLEDLTVHEAMPGHFLQLMHANKFQAPTRLRAVFQSGTFVEGWATYAEQVMAAAGYGGPEVHMQQLKMRLRLILNSILDQKVHTANMAEKDAVHLMMEEGFQEEGEASGKWRRACLTSAQLSTYFVGNTEVNDLVRDYRAAHPEATPAEVHDRVLSFGSPAPRYIRRLLGLD